MSSVSLYYFDLQGFSRILKISPEFNHIYCRPKNHNWAIVFTINNELNRRILGRLVHNGANIPRTAMIYNTLVIRPCFIGARASWQQADDLVDETIQIGNQFVSGLSDQAE